MRGLLGLLVLALVAGCAPRLQRAERPDLIAQAAREEALSADRDWALRARIAVSSGKDGGSGLLEWQQRGRRFELVLRSGMAHRSWRMVGSPGSVMLEGAGPAPVRGRNAETVLAEATGWVIPVESMLDWVRGLRHRPRHAEIESDQFGRPLRIREGGWEIRYEDYIDDSAHALPRKLRAEHGEHRVKLIVQAWEG